MNDNLLEKATKSFPVNEYVPKALQALSPTAVWRVTGDFNYEDIEWLSEDIPKPSKEEVMEKAEQFKKEYDDQQYSRLRAISYPKIEEQLDVLYHQGIDGWKELVDNVKKQYPKPV